VCTSTINRVPARCPITSEPSSSSSATASNKLHPHYTGGIPNNTGGFFPRALVPSHIRNSRGSATASAVPRASRAVHQQTSHWHVRPSTSTSNSSLQTSLSLAACWTPFSCHLRTYNRMSTPRLYSTKYAGISKTTRIHTYRGQHQRTEVLAASRQAARKKLGLEQRGKAIHGMSAPCPKPHPSSLPLESEPACPCPIAKSALQLS
jgi:hypothetical protein